MNEMMALVGWIVLQTIALLMAFTLVWCSFPGVCGGREVSAAVAAWPQALT